MISENFVIVAIIINALGSLSYVIDTVKGKIKPNKVSFLLFGLAPFITFAAQTKQGVGIQSLLALTTGFFASATFVASFFNKKSYWKITLFDIICGGLSILGLILWYLTRIGNMAIVFSIFADVLAALPVVVKSYNYPETESAYPWLLVSISGMLTLLTIKSWTFASYAFPLYGFLINLIIFTLVKFKLGRVRK